MFEEVVTVWGGQTAFLPWCDIKNVNEAQQHWRVLLLVFLLYPWADPSSPVSLGMRVQADELGWGFWLGKIGATALTPRTVRAQGRGQPCRAERLRCQSSCAPMQRLCRPRLSCPASLPSCRPFAKDKWRVGRMWCPSPPSGAACLCQDVSLHIVMKGVIKVTACWNGACSSSALYPSLSCLCKTLARIYTTATRQPIISLKKKKKRQLYH